MNPYFLPTSMKALTPVLPRAAGSKIRMTGQLFLLSKFEGR
jgi:hypothetical protein